MPAIPAPPAKLLASACVEVAQGMASAAAASIARLGGAASLFARVGDDETGARIRADLAAAGVDVSGVRQVAGARSALATILVDDAGERLVAVFYDPNLGDDPAWLPLDRVAAADAVLADVRWPDGAEALLRAGRAAGIPAVLDADSAPRQVLERLVPLASHAIFSDAGLDVLTGGRLAGLGHPGIVGVTCGAAGFRWLEDGREHHVPALAVTAVDTLAAGDVFHGAFALRLAEGATVAEAGRFAAVAASLKCRVFGGRLGCPLRAEVEAVLNCARP